MKTSHFIYQQTNFTMGNYDIHSQWYSDLDLVLFKLREKLGMTKTQFSVRMQFRVWPAQNYPKEIWF